MAIMIRFREIVRKILVGLGFSPIRFREQEFVLENIKKGGKRILDVGCCESLLPIKLARLDYQVTGPDILDYPLTHPNLTFTRGSITDPQIFQGETQIFDTIVCLSTLEHIGIGFYGDPSEEAGDQAALREMSLLLKDEGRLILTVPFGGSYQINNFQRIYDHVALTALFNKQWKVEKETYWIPLSKRKWVQASGRIEAERVYPGFTESNNACFVLSKNIHND